MSELFKILLTSSLTIIGGVLVFSFSQLILRFLIDPVHEQTKAFGEIAFCLSYYSAWYANPGSGRSDDMERASNALRQCAGHLVATSRAIRCYKVFERLRLVPSQPGVKEATGHLIRISNSIFGAHGSNNSRDANQISRLLKLQA